MSPATTKIVRELAAVEARVARALDRLESIPLAAVIVRDLAPALASLAVLRDWVAARADDEARAPRKRPPDGPRFVVARECRTSREFVVDLRASGRLDPRAVLRSLDDGAPRYGLTFRRARPDEIPVVDGD